MTFLSKLIARLTRSKAAPHGCTDEALEDPVPAPLPPGVREFFIDRHGRLDVSL